MAETLSILTSSPLYHALAPLSKLSAHVHSVLLDAKPTLGLLTAAETLESLQILAAKVERSWIDGSMAEVQENDVDPSSRELITAIWTVLKTLLFSSIMTANSILSETIYVPPSSYPTAPPPSTISSSTPQSLALQSLSILSHLSFVITQFGGVTTTATSGTEFPELKKTFYVALDVLSDSEHGKKLANNFVQTLCADESTKGQGTLQQAKKAFALACIEQLVPILDQDILPTVFETCFPHLNDPSHRETYESAHSVVLAMFAAHAQRRNILNGDGAEDWPFMTRSTPFYAKCLIEVPIFIRCHRLVTDLHD
ncbi:hypothetical protein HWV62_3889 [Athelia sp. TMB]|nr:hypothetical protein HWV62_3889 [Athelia sp. TMB]